MTQIQPIPPLAAASETELKAVVIPPGARVLLVLRYSDIIHPEPLASAVEHAKNVAAELGAALAILHENTQIEAFALPEAGSPESR